MLSKVFSRWLPCATLAAWSVIMLHFADPPTAAWKASAQWTHLFTGRVDAFLIPSFRGYVLAAGLVLGLMALVFAFARVDAECCSTSDCSHPLSRFSAGRWLTFLILLLPFTATAVFSPDSFGRGAFLNRGVVTDASSLPQQAKLSANPAVDLPLPSNSAAPAVAVAATPPASGKAAGAQAKPGPENDYLERTPEGYIVAEVLDLLYAAQDVNLRKDFEGKTVQLIGQLMPDTSHNPNGNRFKAVRMFMTCCAADARPVAAVVEAEKVPSLPEMTWIKVVGTATFPVENGKRGAILKADRVEKVDPPSETMLY